VFAGVRRQEDGQALRRAASERLLPVRIDVTDGASITAARDLVAPGRRRRTAGLVNNTGTTMAYPAEFLPLAEFRRQLEVNPHRAPGGHPGLPAAAAPRAGEDRQRQLRRRAIRQALGE
jgi:NADP-dependent 3-hydroxy acid dehydrogenase YdfG